MNLQPMFLAQLRSQFVNRQIGLGRDPVPHPILDTCQLPAPAIALRLRCKRPGLALEPHHVIDELDRNAEPTRRLGMRVALLNKPHGAITQLNRMRFAPL